MTTFCQKNCLVNGKPKRTDRIIRKSGKQNRPPEAAQGISGFADNIFREESPETIAETASKAASFLKGLFGQ